MAIFSDVMGGYTAEDLLPGIAWEESHANPATKYGPRIPGRSERAMGEYQILPSTARWLGYDPNDMLNPTIAREAAKKYMDYLLRRYQGNAYLASAAYNEGPGNIDKRIMPESVSGYAQDVIDYTKGVSTGRRYAQPSRPIPQGNPQMYAARYAPDPSKTEMPPIDYGSIDPNTPMGMLFQSMGAPVGGAVTLKAGEPDLAKIPERKGLFQRLF